MLLDLYFKPRFLLPFRLPTMSLHLNVQKYLSHSKSKRVLPCSALATSSVFPIFASGSTVHLAAQVRNLRLISDTSPSPRAHFPPLAEPTGLRSSCPLAGRALLLGCPWLTPASPCRSWVGSPLTESCPETLFNTAVYPPPFTPAHPACVALAFSSFLP